MILASHVIVSGLIGAETHNYFFAAIIGFASHYILDGIPHWDNYISKEFESKLKTEKNFLATKFFWRQILKVAIDAAIGFIVLFAIFKFVGRGNLAFALTGAFFGTLSDPLLFLYQLKNWRALKWNMDLHDFSHYSIHSKIKQAFWPGIIIQAAAIGSVFVVLKIF